MKAKLKIADRSVCNWNITLIPDGIVTVKTQSSMVDKVMFEVNDPPLAAVTGR